VYCDLNAVQLMFISYYNCHCILNVLNSECVYEVIIVLTYQPDLFIGLSVVSDCTNYYYFYTLENWNFNTSYLCLAWITLV